MVVFCLGMDARQGGASLVSRCKLSMLFLETAGGAAPVTRGPYAEGGAHHQGDIPSTQSGLVGPTGMNHGHHPSRSQCEWSQVLHSVGWLSGSMQIPAVAMRRYSIVGTQAR